MWYLPIDVPSTAAKPGQLRPGNTPTHLGSFDILVTYLTNFYLYVQEPKFATSTDQAFWDLNDVNALELDPVLNLLAAI